MNRSRRHAWLNVLTLLALTLGQATPLWAAREASSEPATAGLESPAPSAAVAAESHGTTGDAIEAPLASSAPLQKALADRLALRDLRSQGITPME